MKREGFSNRPPLPLTPLGIDVAIDVAFGGKADMPFCTAHARFCPKADIG